MSQLEYKSPPHKLINFFKKSRDNWEEKAKQRRMENKNLKAKIRDLKTSRSLWRNKAEEAIKNVQVKDKELYKFREVLDETKAKQELLISECEELKKKRSSR